jgi:hypothetical protein
MIRSVIQHAVALVIVLSATAAAAVDWESPPPPPATVYSVTPGYNWFNPTMRQYYSGRVPGTKYCVSGCTPEAIDASRDYNSQARQQYKNGLQEPFVPVN